MKLANPKTIQDGEKEFFDTVTAELDWKDIEKAMLEKQDVTLRDEIEYKDGDLVVYNNKIAYKFDFEVKTSVSFVFNRQGECLELSTLKIDRKNAEDDPSFRPDQKDKVARLASNIAEMISEINQEDL